MNNQSPYAIPNFYAQNQYQNMNYNPGFFPNSQQYQPQNFNQPQQAPQSNFLNGKIVDGIDVVKATSIPMGGYGIFPKADMSNIYVKVWNDNGTSRVVTFAPVDDNETNESKENNKAMNDILKSMSSVNEKLDSLIKDLRG